MGHRQEPRIQINSRATLCGVATQQARSFLEPVAIRNISARGLWLQITRCVVNPGDVVVLRCGQHKGRFQVVWVKEMAESHQNHLGLQALLPVTLSWGFDLPLVAPDNYRRPRLQARRRHRRFSHSLSVELRVQSSKIPVWSSTRDISETGCFVDMPYALPVSARLNIALWLGDVKVWADGIVVSNLRGSGAGMKLIALPEKGRQRLRELIENSREVRDRRVALDEHLDQYPQTETYSEITNLSHYGTSARFIPFVEVHKQFPELIETAFEVADSVVTPDESVDQNGEIETYSTYSKRSNLANSGTGIETVALFERESQQLQELIESSPAVTDAFETNNLSCSGTGMETIPLFPDAEPELLEMINGNPAATDEPEELKNQNSEIETHSKQVKWFLDN
jgi:PilZ domain